MRTGQAPRIFRFWQTTHQLALIHAKMPCCSGRCSTRRICTIYRPESTCIRTALGPFSSSNRGIRTLSRSRFLLDVKEHLPPCLPLFPALPPQFNCFPTIKQISLSAGPNRCHRLIDSVSLFTPEVAHLKTNSRGARLC